MNIMINVKKNKKIDLKINVVNQKDNHVVLHLKTNQKDNQNKGTSTKPRMLFGIKGWELNYKPIKSKNRNI